MPLKNYQQLRQSEHLYTCVYECECDQGKPLSKQMCFCKSFFAGCSPNFWGPNCSIPCGNCLTFVPCDTENGACQGGCANGWTGDTCHNRKLTNNLPMNYKLKISLDTHVKA